MRLPPPGFGPAQQIGPRRRPKFVDSVTQLRTKDRFDWYAEIAQGLLRLSSGVGRNDAVAFTMHQQHGRAITDLAMQGFGKQQRTCVSQESERRRGTAEAGEKRDHGSLAEPDKRVGVIGEVEAGQLRIHETVQALGTAPNTADLSPRLCARQVEPFPALGVQKATPSRAMVEGRVRRSERRLRDSGRPCMRQMHELGRIAAKTMTQHDQQARPLARGLALEQPVEGRRPGYAGSPSRVPARALRRRPASSTASSAAPPLTTF